MGSLSEVERQYHLSIRLGFVEESEAINTLLISVAKLLVGTKNYLIKKRK